MKHDIDVLGCGVIYIDKERVFGSKPYGLFSTINWKATDEDLKRIADRCLEVIADRKEDMLTHEYCDTCNHIGCEHCIADGNNPYCVPSNYKSKDASKASIGESFTCIITEDRDTQILDGWQVKPKTSTTPKDESKTSGVVWTEDAIKNEPTSYTTWASTDDEQTERSE